MSGPAVIVYFDDSSNKNVTGIQAYDRTNGGTLIAPSGTSFPTPTEAGEWFWRSDQSVLYRRNDANSAWESVTVSASSVDHGGLTGLGDDDHPQYRDGSLAYTGNLDLGANLIENIGPNGGVRLYGKQATNPTTPTPADGDLYYNTAINELMYFDGTRSKWLSVATYTVQAGRNGNTAQNQGYRLMNGMVITTNRGISVQQGTLVSLGVVTPTATASVLEILVNNVGPIASLAHNAVGQTIDNTLNVDFITGFMQPRNAPTGSGGATTSNVQIVMQYKRRV
jgi:hypothetical protein